MRDTDRPEEQPTLGAVVPKEKKKEPEPTRVGEGIMRGADGRLYTDRPLPPV